MYVLNAQNVTIQCNTPNCFFTDPDPFQTVYFANVVNNGKTVSSFNWTTIPANAVVFPPNSNNNTCILNWKNEPNNPVRKIKVVVTFTDNSTVQNEQFVTVKHIAPITSMSVTGASPSTVTTSGSNSELPCGNQAITISVPTPTTDPVQTVTYTWSLPSGWSGSSTSNSISVTPPIAGDGTISVNAKRSDGAIIRSFAVTLSRASAQASVTPQIETLYSSDNNNVLCAGEQRLFGATNINNIYSFAWSSLESNVITFSSPNTMGTYVNGLTNSTGGTVLNLTTTSACGTKVSTWNLAVDKPKVDQMLVDGDSYAPLISQSYGCNGALAVIDIAYTANQTGQNYSWQLNGGNGSYYTYNNGTQAVLYAYNDAAFKVIANNRCGNGSQAYFIRYNTCDGYYRMASPNPTQNMVSVQMDQALGRDALVSIRFISDARSSVVRSFTSDDARQTNHFDKSDHVDFDVSNLPRGTYYLIVEFKEGKSFKETIILN